MEAPPPPSWCWRWCCSPLSRPADTILSSKGGHTEGPCRPLSLCSTISQSIAMRMFLQSNQERCVSWIDLDLLIFETFCLQCKRLIWIKSLLLKDTHCMLMNWDQDSCQPLQLRHGHLLPRQLPHQTVSNLKSIIFYYLISSSRI
jgi:hypothetical protein